MKIIELDGSSLTLEKIRQTCADDVRLKISKDALKAVKKSRDVIERAIRIGKPVYGVNTGFGKLSDVKIQTKDALELQKRLILSHCVATGDYLSIPEVKLVLLFRINSLAKGLSGVSPGLVNHLVEMFNKGVFPAIPEQGSVGASGDLAPLAHVGACMLGVGEAFYQRKLISASEALKNSRMKSYEFLEKEALSLINGTQFSLALLAEAVIQAIDIVKIADIIAAASLDALMGSIKPFDERLHKARPHKGQLDVSYNIRTLMQGSEILESHKDCSKVQDVYSLRCIPQVHGAVRDSLNFAKDVVIKEANSAVDNPLVLGDDIISGGNFHGQILALTSDLLRNALTTLGNISERRINSLTNPDLSGLPAFLVKEGGLNSGFMALQVAAASLCAENRALCYGVSVSSIPTGADKEDIVSMSSVSARLLKTVVKNVKYILAMDAICAMQGLEFRRPLNPGKPISDVMKVIRDVVPSLDTDRYLKDDIEKMFTLIFSKDFIRRHVASLR